ncbi:hypothetical protein PSP6_510058 [Paraburkholderia tropica]|uniref:hypothetical protein n=1 Tax=Paraburkholderia tropica TaxID=92647 RepID=UPI001CB01E6F|nr:hypothetical protein [Paraburkholderia tropica]CAG9228510.1 hypothetical protein PSP6_510058 [Paraburkholderia tropica]
MIIGSVTNSAGIIPAYKQRTQSAASKALQSLDHVIDDFGNIVDDFEDVVSDIVSVAAKVAPAIGVLGVFVDIFV